MAFRERDFSFMRAVADPADTLKTMVAEQNNGLAVLSRALATRERAGFYSNILASVRGLTISTIYRDLENIAGAFISRKLIPLPTMRAMGSVPAVDVVPDNAAADVIFNESIILPTQKVALSNLAVELYDLIESDIKAQCPVDINAEILQYLRKSKT